MRARVCDPAPTLGLAMAALGLALSCGCPRPVPSTDPTALVASSLGGLSCDDVHGWLAALKALPPAAVQRVDASYIRDTCAGAAQISGATLSLAPTALESEPWQLVLACRDARASFVSVRSPVSGAVPAWLPDGRIDVHLTRDRGRVELALHADSTRKNIRLFHDLLAFEAIPSE